MSSLLEAAAALGIAGAVLVLVTAAVTGSVRLHVECLELEGQLYRARQLEHLIDRATLAAGAGPSSPAAVAALASDSVALASDSNGDGVVDSNSSETTAVEIRQAGATARVRIRLGRQTMTVLEAAGHDGALVALDRGGGSATAATASLLEVRLTPRDPAWREYNTRRLFFALPARAAP